MPDRYALLLAGGRGERFWPWSRPERPKQLLPLARGGVSLLRATYDRALALVGTPDRILVMTAMDLREACAAECPGAVVLGEPVGRNTAPAIAAAAHFVPDDAAFAVFPADAGIDDVSAFAADLARCFDVAEREAVLCTIGVRPTGPETNLGYIRGGARLGDRLRRVAQFTEKPDHARAEAWVASGEYVWNAGIFVWRRRVFFDALEAGRPALAGALRDLGVPREPASFEARLAQVFPALEAISVDYAVLEAAPNVVVLDASFDWDDLGTWSAWARRQPRDARGNVVFGDALAIESDNCVVVGEGAPAAAVGLRDMVVVGTRQGTLACRVDETDRVRLVTEALRRKGTP
jgi:mannose-1-phosphate guanylyltransferase/mannose-6-phosphate isomerase